MRALFLLLIPCLIPGVFADDWDDFTNNLATDLAPLISLFGEQVTKQFLSESLNVLDNYIFALAPLGILTAIVSVIRVCGNSSLRAFIGRAHEGPGEAEHELLSCVSETTAELFNDGGISRIFGRPKVLEVVAWEDDLSTNHGKTQITTLRGAVKMGIWKEHLADGSSEDPFEFDIPNLSLNMGIKRRSQFWFYTAALVGSILQLGIIVFAALTVFMFPQHFKKNGKAVADYAFPLFFIGTSLLSVGMFLCAFMIERSSTEYYYHPQKKCKIYWLQQGGQQVGDQVFGAFLGMRERGDGCSTKELPYIKSLRNDNYRNKDTWLLTAILLTMAGFVCQFVGLRGLHSSITLVQLGSTLLMAIIRTSLRTQRTDLDDNLLSSEERRLNSIRNQELDCFSFHLENIKSFLVSGQVDQPHRQSSPRDSDTKEGQGRQIIETRAHLAALTHSEKKERDSAWDDMPTRNVAINLRNAIQETMELVSSWSNKRLSSYKFGISLQSESADKPDSSVLEKYNIHLRKPDGSMHWEVDAAVLEAIVGLWTWSLLYSDHDIPWQGPFYRIIGQDHQEASEEETLLVYYKWIFRHTPALLAPPHSIPLSRGMFGYRISPAAGATTRSILAMRTHNPLHVMTAQDIYIYFLNSAFGLLSELGGETGILPNGVSFVAHSSRIEQLVRCFEANHLGSRQDALLCIVPALRRRGILPELSADSPPVRQQVEKYIAAGEWSEAFSLLQWFCERSGGTEFERSADEMGYLCCRAMLSPDSNVRAEGFKRVSTAIRYDPLSDFVHDIAAQRPSNWILCEKKSSYWDKFSPQLGWVAWHIANRLREQSFVQYLMRLGVGDGCISGRSDNESPASQIGRNGVIRWLTTGDNILDCNISGEEEKLSLEWLIDQGHSSLLCWMMIRWTEIGALHPHFLQAMLQLVSQCQSDTAIQIMRRHGADMNARSNVDVAGGHTALMQEIAEGDEKSVLRLLQHGADVNAASPSNLTPLVFAAFAGHTQIVNMLLEYGAHIEAREHKANFAALNAATDNNNLAVVKLLVEKGAYIDPASLDGMTPLLLAVSKGNIEIAKFLIEHGANMNAQNDSGYTPLMLAIEKHETSIASELLRRGCDVNAKDRSGLTAFDWARNTGKEDCLALLESTHSQGSSREVA
ncbi:hypothetical protein DTO195F2_3052 [Paecilomyces variotii]|nr:hypothetical protein DTO195F2_3052 [Paecilomyces variotii]KAJ9302593.1 hypothetical protein DTO217A2_7225 [Paecilomyces variotii]KAJ9373792.1 hypothetical protein DTO282E5_1576 [Paecilomyces variotii]KAJ9400555.1 hypothetical protein DTO282F9_2440 [Paecilomyces variotii]